MTTLHVEIAMLRSQLHTINDIQSSNFRTKPKIIKVTEV